MFESNQIEQAQDDDVDTDDEVKKSGIETCKEDHRDLRQFMRKNKNFRAKTNIV
jgi:hypothetical protein